MKLIIDIPEYTFERITEYYDALPEGSTVDANVCYIANGTPIPDNATVCDIEQIRAEIDGIEINGQVDEHTMFIRTGEQVKQMALDIIDNLTKGE